MPLNQVYWLKANSKRLLKAKLNKLRTILKRQFKLPDWYKTCSYCWNKVIVACRHEKRLQARHQFNTLMPNCCEERAAMAKTWKICRSLVATKPTNPKWTTTTTITSTDSISTDSLDCLFMVERPFATQSSVSKNNRIKGSHFSLSWFSLFVFSITCDVTVYIRPSFFLTNLLM